MLKQLYKLAHAVVSKHLKEEPWLFRLCISKNKHQSLYDGKRYKIRFNYIKKCDNKAFQVAQLMWMKKG